MYLTGTYGRSLDAKSRITLPATFRKQFDVQVCLVPVGNALYGFTPEDIARCGIEREVAIVGNIDHFEIWDSSSLSEQMDELDQDLDELMFSE